MDSQILDFDSGITGFLVAKLILGEETETNLTRELSNLKNQGVRLAYFETNHPEYFPKYSKDIICQMNHYVSKMDKLSAVESAEIVVCQDLKNLVRLQELGQLIMIKSRFGQDRNFPPKISKEIYDRWVENSLLGKAAFQFLIYQKQDQILGFVTLTGEKPIGEIGLLAVDPIAQGQGIGFKLLTAAKNLFSQQNFSTLRIKTQTNNLPACFLYEKKLKLPLSLQSSVYHFWL